MEIVYAEHYELNGQIRKDLKAIHDENTKFKINGYNEIIKLPVIDNTDSDEDSDERCDYYIDKYTYLIVMPDSTIAGFFKSDEYSVKDILLSHKMDWICAIREIIDFKIRTNNEEKMLEIVTDNEMIKTILVDYFDAKCIGSRYQEHLSSYCCCVFTKCTTNKTFSDNLKIKIDVFSKQDRNDTSKITSYTTNFIVGKIHNSPDCGCVLEEHLLIFKEPLILKEKDFTWDAFIDMHIFVNGKKYVVSDNSICADMRLNKFVLEYTLLMGYSEFESTMFIQGIYVPNSFEQKLVSNGVSMYKEYFSPIRKVKKCKTDDCHYPKDETSIRSDRALLSLFVFGKLKMDSQKCMFQHKNKQFVVNNSFVPQKVIKFANTKKTEYCYVIHLREFVNLGEDVYKIGKTVQQNFDRFKGYPKGSIIKIFRQVDNCTECEKALMDEFNDEFTKRDDLGREYYEGKYKDIEEKFLSITDKFKC